MLWHRSDLNRLRIYTGSVVKEIAYVSDVNGLNVQFHDVLDFGDKGDLKDKFLKWCGTNHSSHDSTALAYASGQVVAVSISTEENSGNNFYVQIVVNATKSGSGIFKGGTQIGVDLEKPAGVLDKFYRNLTGFDFSADDRLQVYIKEGTAGGKKAVEPAVRLFLKF